MTRIPKVAMVAEMEGRPCRMWHDGKDLRIRFTDRKKPRGYVYKGAYVSGVDMPSMFTTTENLKLHFDGFSDENRTEL